MEEDLRNLEVWLKEALAAADSFSAVDAVRVEILGKKGTLTKFLKSLSRLPEEVRARQGAAANTLKKTAIHLIQTRLAELQNAALETSLVVEQIDTTLSARPERIGCIHPVSQTLEEVMAIFSWMGFTVVEGPDIEDDFHNFTALNIPPEHPARQMHDTFYLPGQAEGARFLLRTHTSPVQIRTLQAKQPPIHVIAPGRAYRRDSDVTHTPMFHQIEGLVVNATTHLGHLKSCIMTFIHCFFETSSVQVRFRPSFFPFTTSSAEVDIGFSCVDSTLSYKSNTDWLEIMGCGMVHPHVFTSCGLDVERWQGFAFGMGVERLAMLKYGIPDLRTFYESDLRWLRHYGFLFWDIPVVAGQR